MASKVKGIYKDSTKHSANDSKQLNALSIQSSIKHLNECPLRQYNRKRFTHVFFLGLSGIRFLFLIRHIVTFADHSIFCESHNRASECASVYMTTRRRLCSDSVWVNIGVGVCSILASQLENSWRWSSDWGVRSMCLRFFFEGFYAAKQ